MDRKNILSRQWYHGIKLTNVPITSTCNCYSFSSLSNMPISIFDGFYSFTNLTQWKLLIPVCRHYCIELRPVYHLDTWAILNMVSEIPNHLLLVMVRTLAMDDGYELKKDVLQHLLSMWFGFYWIKTYTKYVNFTLIHYSDNEWQE